MSNGDKVFQLIGTIYEDGYGLLAQKVMRDKDLSSKAKLIYAYLCSFAGMNSTGERTAFPSVKLICNELGIKSDDTFYKHRKQLIEKGYITIEKQRKQGNFYNNIYYINAVPSIAKKEKEEKIIPYPNKSGMPPYPNKSSTVKSSTVKSGTNNNNLLKNNSFKEEEEIINNSDAKKSENIYQEVTKEFLKLKNTPENIITSILEKIEKQNITDFTYRDLETQFNRMIETNEKIYDFASYFVGGLRKLVEINQAKEEHKKQKAIEEKIKEERARKFKEISYDWLAE